ncbi:MAG TPA: UDP-N-acetylglucosamine 2-epimerase, partial [bacterium]|nr:UDP-N-acetylglucosamine 2-epimerase [bacterium]
MKKICIVTGSRAEYGLLRPLMDEIKRSKNFDLQIIATGMHLSSDFGYTYKEIEKDGFKISHKLDISLKSDTAKGISKSMGVAMIGFGEVFSNLKPDMIVV